MVSKEKVEQMTNFYTKYGMITLLVGRFIPFGVRNAYSLTAGLGKMNFLKFALADLVACTISCTLFFNLYFNYGESVIEYVKKGNIIIFSILLIALTGWLINKKRSTNSK